MGDAQDAFTKYMLGLDLDPGCRGVRESGRCGDAGRVRQEDLREKEVVMAGRPRQMKSQHVVKGDIITFNQNYCSRVFSWAPDDRFHTRTVLDVKTLDTGDIELTLTTPNGGDPVCRLAPWIAVEVERK